MTGGILTAPYILAALWMLNGDPMHPGGWSTLPNNQTFPTKRECIAAMVDYLGAIDPRRGRLACIPGVRQ